VSDQPEDVVDSSTGAQADKESGTGWWSKSKPAGAPTTPAHPNGDAASGPEASTQWNWELPTDAIGSRRRWTSAQLPVPIVFVLVLVMTLLAAGIGSAIGIASERGDHGGGSGPIVFAGTAPTTAPASTRGASIAGVAANVLPSVVEVDVSAGSAKDTGSGFVIATRGTSAYILTNNHVISLAATQHGKVRVVLQNGTSLGATIRGRATTYDLAILIVNRVSGLKPVTLGDSNSLAVGDPVIAIGSPLGLAGTVTSGIVSAVDRPVAANGEGTDTNAVIDAIQTDAAINPGNSGGPLVDASGHVIGVNSAIATLSSGGGNPFGSQDQGGSIGLGFAIPIDSARNTSMQIIKSGFAVRPIIGVSLDALYDGNPPGGLIGCPPQANNCTPVQSGGPGDKAGLRTGDIIVAVDGKPTPSSDEVVVLTRKHQPGDVISVAFIRSGQRKTVSIKLGSARA
jgi:putative serine protease PepD